MRKILRPVFLLFLLAGAAGVAHAQNKVLQAGRVRNRGVLYAPAAKVRKYPLPVVNFQREGLARKGDVREIMDGVVYPLVNRSRKPVAAIVVTFYPDEAHITVLVLWHGEAFSDILIKRNAQGHFARDAYKVFFEEAEEP